MNEGNHNDLTNLPVRQNTAGSQDVLADDNFSTIGELVSTKHGWLAVTNAGKFLLNNDHQMLWPFASAAVRAVQAMTREVPPASLHHAMAT